MSGNWKVVQKRVQLIKDAANYESRRLCSSLVFKVLLKISSLLPKCSLKKLFTSSSLCLCVVQTMTLFF